MVADGIESDERESDERKSTGGEKREGNYIFTVWRSGLEELRNLRAMPRWAHLLRDDGQSYDFPVGFDPPAR